MNATPIDWKRLFELLDTFFELEARERQGWLESLSGVTAATKAQLLKLIAQRATLEGSDFLSVPPSPPGGSSLASTPATPPSAAAAAEGASIAPPRELSEALGQFIVGLTDVDALCTTFRQYLAAHEPERPLVARWLKQSAQSGRLPQPVQACLSELLSEPAAAPKDPPKKVRAAATDFVLPHLGQVPHAAAASPAAAAIPGPAGVATAGKLPECGLQLQAGSAGGGPSRRHAELSVVEDTVWVEDLRSTNGTFVNGERITARTALKSGDVLRFDMEEFKFRAESLAPVEERTAMREVPAVPGSWVEEKGKSKTVFVDYSKLASEKPAAGGTPLPGTIDAPLLVSSGSRAGARIPLVAAQGAKREWAVGCDPDRDIVFTDKGVSGRHAKIVNEGTRWKLIDQLAANGTFVNGNRTNMSFLASGDRIRFGPVECVFQLPAAAGIAQNIAGSRSADRDLCADRARDRIRGDTLLEMSAPMPRT